MINLSNEGDQLNKNTVYTSKVETWNPTIKVSRTYPKPYRLNYKSKRTCSVNTKDETTVLNIETHKIF